MAMSERIVKTSRGYLQKIWNDPEAGELRREYIHRLVWEEHFGPIPPGDKIHHKDGNKENNDISNLECKSASQHISDHNKQANRNPNVWSRKRRGRKVGLTRLQKSTTMAHEAVNLL